MYNIKVGLKMACEGVGWIHVAWDRIQLRGRRVDVGLCIMLKFVLKLGVN
jgi:hypothetical protein